ncbi:hypothetical protein B0T10DRAFT_109802 [Thelonectria olida]|uniref:Uncharacterized protein n=1 Tax=Thelonectria olida TaxID=1576542 RepID=A0A9P8WGA6_9HYPO|nr:hypothetical protein B0T10DRAFT_109802 [Thelonectria olida]
MRSYQRRHDRRPSISIRRQTTNQLQESNTAVNLGSTNDYIQYWLSQVEKSQNRGEPCASWSNDEDAGRGGSHRRETNWYPNNLPVGCVIPSRTSKPRQTLHFPDDDTIVTSPAASPTRDESSPRRNRVSNNRYSRANTKRRRSPSCDSQRSLSEESDFKKKPRRKTNLSRYETKKGKLQAKEDSKPREKKTRSRAKKRELRSSRDVVDNFTSDAFSDKRLTMRPSLTAGLFLNGRSSTNKGKLTDLVFNDMSFLKAREDHTHHKQDCMQVHETNDSSSVKDFYPAQGPVVDSRDDQDRTPETTQVSLTTNTESPLFIPQTSPAHQLGGGFQRASNRHTERGHVSEHSEDQQHEFRDEQAERGSDGPKSNDPLSLNGDDTHSTLREAPSRSQTPASIRRALVETGVFDGTRISCNKSRNQRVNAEIQGECEARELRERSPSRDPSLHHNLEYNDRGVMVTPTLHSVQPGPLQHLPRDDRQNEYEDLANNAELLGDGPLRLCTGSIPPVPLHESTWGATDMCQITPSSLDGPEIQYENPGHQNVFDPRVDESHVANCPGSKAFPTLVQGDSCFLLPEQVEDLPFRPFTSFAHGRQPSKPTGTDAGGLYCRADVYNGISPFARPFDDQPASTVNLGPTSLPHLQMSSFAATDPDAVHQETFKTNHGLHPYEASTNETMKDFIDRIEAEVLLEWNEEEPLHDMVCYGGSEPGQIQVDRYHTGESSGELDMASFWQPNRFM